MTAVPEAAGPGGRVSAAHVPGHASTGVSEDVSCGYRGPGSCLLTQPSTSDNPAGLPLSSFMAALPG